MMGIKTIIEHTPGYPAGFFRFGSEKGRTDHLTVEGHNGEYTTKPQFSWGLELIAPDTKLPFHTALNVGFDKGDLLKNSFGIMPVW